MKMFNSDTSIYLRGGLIAIAVVFCGSGVAENTAGKRSSGYVAVANDDVYRGLQRHDHEIAIQAGLTYALTDAIVVGGQLHQAQFPDEPGEFYDEIEFHHFISWSTALNRNIDIQLRAARYAYPNSDDDEFEYDYNELSVAAFVAGGWSIHASVWDTSLNFTDGFFSIELGWSRALAAELHLNANVGWIRPQGSFGIDYEYWDVGVSRPIGPFMLDVRYHDSSLNERWFGRQPANSRLVFSATYGW